MPTGMDLRCRRGWRTSGMNRLHIISTSQLRMTWLLALACALCGCQVQLISQYDQQTDDAATDVQKRLEGFLLEMGALSESDLPESRQRRSLRAQSDFYRELDVAISSMRLRAEAIPQNERTIEQIALLEDSVQKLKALHAEAGDRGLRWAIAAPLRELFNA